MVSLSGSPDSHVVGGVVACLPWLLPCSLCLSCLLSCVGNPEPGTGTTSRTIESAARGWRPPEFEPDVLASPVGERGNVSSWADVLQQEPDPGVVTDELARARMVASGWPWRIRERRSGIVLVLIPEGQFTMGSPLSEVQRDPVESAHVRKIRRAFYLGECEVSQVEWQRVTAGNPSKHVGGDFPVEQVSWVDAQRFVKAIGLRLPSEAEWEYACRAGTTTPFAFGASITWNQVNFNAGFQYMEGASAPHGDESGIYRQETIEVGELARNAWGLADMHGNVWEWCEDVPCAYPAGRADERPAIGPSRGARVLRGGAWYLHPRFCRSASRFESDASKASDGYGLRVAATPR